MTMKIEGSCHCRKITFHFKLSRPTNEYSPRACDCSFCIKHGASYLSDPEGSLEIYLEEVGDLHRYKQEDTNGIADFMICSNCGVLLGVIYDENKRIWGAVNNLAINSSVRFKEKLVVSPKKFSDKEKVERWKQVWFPNVRINLK